MQTKIIWVGWATAPLNYMEELIMTKEKESGSKIASVTFAYDKSTTGVKGECLPGGRKKDIRKPITDDLEVEE